MKPIRSLAAVATMALTSLGLAGTADAAPVKSPNVFPLTCDAPVGEVFIVSPPNDANFTPGFIVGTHQILVPYAFDFTFTSSSAPDEPFSAAFSKKAPVPAGAITCFLNISETDPVTGETFTGTGSVVAVVRGMR